MPYDILFHTLLAHRPKRRQAICNCWSCSKNSKWPFVSGVDFHRAKRALQLTYQGSNAVVVIPRMYSGWPIPGANHWQSSAAKIMAVKQSSMICVSLRTVSIMLLHTSSIHSVPDRHDSAWLTFLSEWKVSFLYNTSHVKRDLPGSNHHSNETGIYFPLCKWLYLAAFSHTHFLRQPLVVYELLQLATR